MPCYALHAAQLSSRAIPPEFIIYTGTTLSYIAFTLFPLHAQYITISHDAISRYDISPLQPDEERESAMLSSTSDAYSTSLIFRASMYTGTSNLLKCQCTYAAPFIIIDF